MRPTIGRVDVDRARASRSAAGHPREARAGARVHAALDALEVRGVGAHGVLDVDGRLAVDGLGVLLEHLALALDGRLVRLERVAEDLGRTREIQRRFNVSVPRARVTENTSTLRDRSER